MTSACTSSPLCQPRLILKPRRETPSSSIYRTHRRRVGLLRRNGDAVIRCDYTRFEREDEVCYCDSKSHWFMGLDCFKGRDMIRRNVVPCIMIKDVSYRSPGTQVNLLKDVSFSLREKSFGLIFGQSGSGKTTLLQLIAGLTKPTAGSVCVQRYNDDGAPKGAPQSLTPEKVGIVFQFPERQKSRIQLKEQLALKLQRAFSWVGLDRISLGKNPQSLSGGYKRRLALAIQLVEVPDLLVLDEPLAGLDWKARADVVRLLKHLKREVAILVVSHDLRELAALVDQSWKIEMGGILQKDSVRSRTVNPYSLACVSS